MKVEILQRSMSTSEGLKKLGDVVDLPAAEIEKILVTKPRSMRILDEAPKKAPAKRKAKAVKADD